VLPRDGHTARRDQLLDRYLDDSATLVKVVRRSRHGRHRSPARRLARRGVQHAIPRGPAGSGDRRAPRLASRRIGRLGPETARGEEIRAHFGTSRALIVAAGDGSHGAFSRPLQTGAKKGEKVKKMMRKLKQVSTAAALAAGDRVPRERGRNPSRDDLDRHVRPDADFKATAYRSEFLTRWGRGELGSRATSTLIEVVP